MECECDDQPQAINDAPGGGSVEPTGLTTFRVMESLDEHFYEQDLFFNFNYHWPMHGFGLPDDVLKKVYHDTAIGAFQRARSSARG